MLCKYETFHRRSSVRLTQVEAARADRKAAKAVAEARELQAKEENLRLKRAKRVAAGFSPEKPSFWESVDRFLKVRVSLANLFTRSGLTFPPLDSLRRPLSVGHPRRRRRRDKCRPRREALSYFYFYL